MDSLGSIDEISNKREPRPTFLTVLCVLSFIFIGFSLLFGLFAVMKGPLDEEGMMEKKVEISKSVDEMRNLNMEGLAEMMEKVSRMSESLNANFYTSSILSILVMGLGLFGVIKMWNGYKLGFHLYIAYSLMTIIQVYFFVSAADISTFVVIWNLIISTIFVFLYSRNLKWLV